MKITREQLLNIVKEEYAAVQELGPATGHEEGTNAVDVVKMIGDDLIETGEMMSGLSSTTTASEFAGYVKSKGEEALEAHAELSSAAPMQEKTLVKEDWVDELYNALYALEDKVEGVVVDTELEQVYRKFHSMLKAHILEKSKVRDAARKEGGV